MKFAHSSARGRAFTLIELLVVVVIIALLVALLLPSLADSKRVSRLAVCQSNYKQFGVAVANYATDFADRLASFTWEQGVDYGSGFGAAANQTQASADQAVDILRRRANRSVGAEAINQITGWIPHVLYTHLVLNDYLQQRLPEPMVACPEDRQRQKWQENVRRYGSNWWQSLTIAERPGGTALTNADQRWPYSSSYNFVPAEWAPDQATRRGATVINTVSQQGNPHYLFTVPAAFAATTGHKLFYGSRKLSDVSFPSTKVMMYDGWDRHSNKRRQLYFMYPEARQPLLFFDTSVANVKTEYTNQGFRPNDPLNPGPSLITYDPDTWEPPNRSGNFNPEGVRGYYRWTRAGLRGVDYKQGEVPARAP